MADLVITTSRCNVLPTVLQTPIFFPTLGPQPAVLALEYPQPSNLLLSLTGLPETPTGQVSSLVTSFLVPHYPPGPKPVYFLQHPDVYKADSGERELGFESGSPFY